MATCRNPSKATGLLDLKNKFADRLDIHQLDLTIDSTIEVFNISLLYYGYRAMNSFSMHTLFNPMSIRIFFFLHTSFPFTLHGFSGNSKVCERKVWSSESPRKCIWHSLNTKCSAAR